MAVTRNSKRARENDVDMASDTELALMTQDKRAHADASPTPALNPDKTELDAGNTDTNTSL